MGGATAGSVIQVFATPSGSSASRMLIAAGVANDARAWAAMVAGGPMPDGSYRITATASNSAGTASTYLGTVVIDTIAPVITNVVFRRLRGEMDVFSRDNLSGVFLPDVSHGANYQLSATPLNDQIPVRNNIIPTKVRVTPASTPTGVDEAIVVFNCGRTLPAGTYTFRSDRGRDHRHRRQPYQRPVLRDVPRRQHEPRRQLRGPDHAYANKVLGTFPIQAGFAKPKPVAAIRSQARAETVASSRSIHAAQAQAGAHRPNQGPATLVDHALESIVGPRQRRRGR